LGKRGTGAKALRWPPVLGVSVADKDIPETKRPETAPETPEGPLSTDSLARIVELARQEMRERGFTDEQIEVLLRRKKAPDGDR
jgi:hypothetical protein